MVHFAQFHCCCVGIVICEYRIAGNVCGNLILRFAVETENTKLCSTQFYFYAMCIGIIIRRGSDCNVSTCTEAQRGMGLSKYISRHTSITKPSSSLLTIQPSRHLESPLRRTDRWGCCLLCGIVPLHGV